MKILRAMFSNQMQLPDATLGLQEQQVTQVTVISGKGGRSQ